jgi:hypothetical protein
MPIALAVIGTLVGITKSVVETIKNLKDLFATKDSKRISNEAETKLLSIKDNFSNFYGRMDILSIQLEQSTVLTKMVPAWLEVASLMPVWTAVENLTNDDIRRIDMDLRRFMHDSIRDHFSSTFFGKNFDKLPDVENHLVIFRAKLKDLDRTVSAIPPSNSAAFKSLWPSITTQFNDLRNAAFDTSNLAEQLQGQLIHELRDSAQQAVFLN